jgi:hypothetical protein
MDYIFNSSWRRIHGAQACFHYHFSGRSDAAAADTRLPARCLHPVKARP